MYVCMYNNNNNHNNKKRNFTLLKTIKSYNLRMKIKQFKDENQTIGKIIMVLHFIENNWILQFKDENQTISNTYNFKLYQYSKIFTQF